jgi:glutathione S-transferase
VELKLYAIPGSHPCATVEAALALKGLAYERVDLLPGASQLIQRARFGRRTVPGLIVDGYRVSGSRLILRTLDGLQPEPRLYPADPERLAAVEEAERWGDAELQTTARWAIVYALSQRPEAGDSYLEGSNLPRLPAPISAQATRAVFTAELRILAGGPSGAERSLRELPAQLDHVDGLITDGVIGGDPPNAADLQIGASLRLLLTLEDLREPIDARPCGRLARRLFPRFPGEIPAGTLPADWIPAHAPRAEVPAVG